MKRFWKSKTFWFNVLALLIAVANMFGFAGFEPSQDAAEVISVVVAVINIVLRFATKVPIR